MKVVILIPARFASSRYPGKPLVQLRGAGGTAKSLIQRSFEAASRVPGVDAVHIVTDRGIAHAAAGLSAGQYHDVKGGPQWATSARRALDALMIRSCHHFQGRR